jgi:hypothetical protein
MSEDKRGLGRGLDDLMAQNEIDLPFLASYGPAADIEEDISQAKTPPSEIFDAVLRHLSSLACKYTMHNDKEVRAIGLVGKIGKQGVNLSFKHKVRLPFVPSDLASPGLSRGKLSSNGCSASVTIQAWGIEARRIIARYVEHVEINFDE